MPFPDAVRESDRVRELLLDIEVASAARLFAEYEDLLDEITRRTRQIARLNLGRGFGPRTLSRLLTRIQAGLGLYAADIVRRVTLAQGMAVNLSESQIRSVVERGLPAGLTVEQAAMVGLRWRQVSRSVMEQFVGTTGSGQTLVEFTGAMPREVSRRVADVLTRGLAEQLPQDQVVAGVRKEMGRALNHALGTNTTEVQRSFRESTRVQYRENRQMVGGYRRRAIQDTSTCFACIALDGTVYETSMILDEHPNGRCLPAGTLVSGPSAVAASQRFHVGEMVTIQTASGVELSFTPNHPILTPGGWVAGGLLQEGGYVVRSLGQEQAVSGIYVHDEDVPTPIEEVCESLGVVSLPVPSSAENFHGDGEGSEVYVVRTDGLLGDRGYAAVTKPRPELAFCRAHAGLATLTGDGNLGPVLVGLAPTPGGGLGHADPSQLLFAGHTVGHQAVSSAGVTQDCGGGPQPSNDSSAAHSERRRETVGRLASVVPPGQNDIVQAQPLSSGGTGLGGAEADGLAPRAEMIPGGQCVPEPSPADVVVRGGLLQGLTGEVSLDRIMKLTVSRFAGHVYNLQTRVGWYIANGIVTHNCFMVPISTLEQPDEAMPDDARTWFARQPADTQRGMMGPGKFAAWKAGAYELDDMAKVVSNPTWGSAAVEKALKDLVPV